MNEGMYALKTVYTTTKFAPRDSW